MKIIQEELEFASKTVSDTQDYQYESRSKMTKKILHTDRELESLIEEESRVIVEPSHHGSLNLIKQKTSTENLKSLHSKFKILNQKAHRFINSLPAQTSVSTINLHALKNYYHSNHESSKIITLPSIKRGPFFDPTPLPSDFQINRDLIVASYE